MVHRTNPLSREGICGGGLTVTFEDKTEERRAQWALAESEQRYALVSEAAEWDIENDRFFCVAAADGAVRL